MTTEMATRLAEARLFEILLGTALRKGDVQDDLVSFGFSVDDIDHPTHKAMWLCMVELREVRGLSIPGVVEALMIERGVPADEAAEFIAACCRDTTVDSGDLRNFVLDLRQRVALRRIAAIARKAEKDSRSPLANAAAISAWTASSMAHAVAQAAGLASSTGEILGDMLLERLHSEAPTSQRRMRTYFPALDGALGGGILERTIFLLLANSGVGKSTITNHVTLNTALAGDGVFYASTEMPKEQQIALWASQLAGFEWDGDVGSLVGDQRAALIKAAEVVRSLPIFYFDAQGRTVAEAATELRAVCKLHDVKLAAWDYAQGFADPVGSFGREDLKHERRSMEIDEVTKETGVASLVLSQMAEKPQNPRTPDEKEDRPAGSRRYTKDASAIATAWRDKGSKELWMRNLMRVSLFKNRYGFGRTVDAYAMYGGARLTPCNERGEPDGGLLLPNTINGGVDFAKARFRIPKKTEADGPPKEHDDAPW